MQQEEKGCGAGVGGVSGQVTAKPEVPPAAGSSVTPTPAQTPGARVRGLLGEGHRGPGPTLLQLPQPCSPPAPCRTHLAEGGAAEGRRLHQVAVFVDVDQALAEGPAPRHVDDGHAVLEREPHGVRPRAGDPASPQATRQWRLTQAESAKGTSGRLTVRYSLLVHTATTRVPAAVKKASNPEPPLVKKLGEAKPAVSAGAPAGPGTAPRAPGGRPPTCTAAFAGAVEPGPGRASSPWGAGRARRGT